MIYTALIDLDNRQILYAEEIPEDNEEYASVRYFNHDMTAKLFMRDNPGQHWQAYRGNKPFEFLPDTDEEVSEAMSASDTSGVDALSS